jgi:hypothetical protein
MQSIKETNFFVFFDKMMQEKIKQNNNKVKDWK